MEKQILIAKRPDKIIYREGDKIVKLFDESYSKSNILNEALNQTRVAETGLKIPKIHEITLREGKSAIVMEYIKGKTFEELFREEPERREEYLALFIRTQCEIHSKKQFLLTKFADKLKMKIMQSELSASTRYDLSMRVDAMPRHTHLCHGDYNPSNVILSEGGVPYIIDWSHASQGNATADGVKTYYLLKVGGWGELAERYMEDYCAALRISKEYFLAWKPLVAAAQLIRSEKPADTQMLMEWVRGE